MFRSRTLFNYFILESIPPFFLGLLVFSFILITGNMLRILQVFITRSVEATEILKLIFYLFIPLFSFVIPMAVMLSIMVALSRFSTDNEITAFKSLGISPHKFFFPALIMGITASIMTASITIYFAPRAFREVKKISNRMLESGVTSTLREGAFTEITDDLTVYAKTLGRENNHFYDVLIYDSRGKINNYVAYAKEGYITSSPEGYFISIHLINGSIHIRSEDYERLRVINFSSYTLNLPINFSNESTGKYASPKEMPTMELIKYIRKAEGSRRDIIKASIQLGRRFSFPFAAIVFAIVSIPIGFLSPREGKLWGFTLSIILFAMYYIFLIAGENLALREIIPGGIATWTPNLLFIIVGGYLTTRLSKPG